MTPEQDPTPIFEFLRRTGLAYLWLCVLPIWGGTASYLSRIKRERSPFRIVELIGEWSISGFAGVVTFYVCQSLKWDYATTAAATGIAGHMGGRAIFLAENLIIRAVSRYFGLTKPAETGE